MKELVVQNYNVNGIVVWGLSNEITMAGSSDEDLLENHRILNDMVHEMDHETDTIAVVSMCDIHDPYIRFGCDLLQPLLRMVRRRRIHEQTVDGQLPQRVPEYPAWNERVRMRGAELAYL